MITHPPYLRPGSLVGITCPSGFVSKERVAYACEVLQLWGFRVKMGATVGSEFNYFSADDEGRLRDLQMMLDDPEVEAILMGRGGYGLSRIIDQIDFSCFRQQPKWICGFSDITVLHSHIAASFGIPTLHSPMGAAFKPETTNADHIKNFYAALTGESMFYHAPPSPFNREGQAEGVLTGGNLAILAHLVGSVSDVDTRGKLLFIEDIGEHLYKIDRMMLTLKRAGKLDGLRGLLIGGFTEVEDTDRPFGQTVEEIIFDKVKEYDYPVSFNLPAGHIEENYTLALGMMHKLQVTEKEGRLVAGN